MFVTIHNDDVRLNILQISDIDQSDTRCWEIHMASGNQYSVDEKEDMKAIEEAIARLNGK